ncbi:MAG: hypothetical protein ACYC54_07515 [Sedimentisphaerales bacterium]
MSEPDDVKQGIPRLNPAALTVEMVAKMLGIQVQIVQKHISEGAPVAVDGTINLVHYGAWLCKMEGQTNGA